MIQTQIFNTPTGDTYRPADRIERSLARTGNILEKGIREQYDRDKEQEQQFMSIYSNLGEIEGILQEQYAGINQHMVDSTKNFVAESYKKGISPTDPEFRMLLSKMTGAIRGGMGKAENNIKQIRPFHEMLLANPYISNDDKNKLSAQVLSLSSNPDFLISPNPVDFMSMAEQYERPELIMKEHVDSFKTNGEYETIGFDKNGNQVRTTVLMNDFTNRDQPTDELGRINAVIPPEYNQKAFNRELPPKVQSVLEKTAKEMFGEYPRDVALGMAAQHWIKNTMTGRSKTSIMKTAQQLADEEENQKLDRLNTRLSIKLKENDLLNVDATAAQQQQYQTDFEKFVNSASKMDKAFLAQYSGEKVKDLDYKIKLGDQEVSESDLKYLQSGISSKKNWDSLSEDERIMIGKNLGVNFTNKIPLIGAAGKWTKEGYDDVVNAYKNTAVRPVIKFKERETTSDGMYNWSDREFDLSDGEDLETAFVSLEKLNMSGAKPKQKIPTVNNSGGINYGEK